MTQSFNERYRVKAVTITNGFDEEDVQTGPTEPIGGKFTIVHVGSINKDRNHQVFWESIAELIEENQLFRSMFELHFIGKTDYAVKESISRYKLSDFVRHISYLSHDQVIKYEKQATVLYLPINNTPNSKGIITGKLFEYLASGRPIVAIAPPDGDMAVILGESGAGWVSHFDDKEGLKGNIDVLFDQFLSGTLQSSSKNIEKYTRKGLTKELVEVMNQLVS